MGLGKTLSMIALIASDQDCNTGNLPPAAYSVDIGELHSTLIVVPLNGEGNCHSLLRLTNLFPVLAVWESQLKR